MLPVLDFQVQESRVGRIFRQTDLKYSSWDARTADTKKNLKKVVKPGDTTI